MSRELPYFKFNVNSWITGDITLCSIESQGLFINLCAFYWSKNCNISLTFVERKFKSKEILDELIDVEMIEVKDGNIIINFLDEQMSEFIDISKKRSNAGKKSAEKRASLKENQTSDEQVLNKPPAKVNNIDKIREDKSKEDKIDYKMFLEIYNSYAINLPKIKFLSADRKSHIKARINETDEQTVTDVFMIANESSFLCGNNDRKWKASFDWIINATNFHKIYEGNFSKETIKPPINLEHQSKQPERLDNAPLADPQRKDWEKLVGGMK